MGQIHVISFLLWGGVSGVVPVSVPARRTEQRHAGDGLQRPLRFRFQPRLMPGVDGADASRRKSGESGRTPGETKMAGQEK